MQQHSHTFHVMGGPAQLLLQTDDIALWQRAKTRCEQLARHYEHHYSRYRDDSIISQINRSGGQAIKVDDETAALLDYADQAFKISEGLFDITSGVLRRVWNFREAIKPNEAQITVLLTHIGWSRVIWQRPYLTLPVGMEIDLGGLVKEFAADAIATQLRALGVQHGLISLAGDIAVIGAQFDGRGWLIGISDPDQPERAKATIELHAGALATSGDYERFFMVDDQRYCHILNPFTGYPVQGVAGVSVQAPLCIVAGTLSTIAMLKGPEAGRAFLNSTGLPFLLFER